MVILPPRGRGIAPATADQTVRVADPNVFAAGIISTAVLSDSARRGHVARSIQIFTLLAKRACRVEGNALLKVAGLSLFRAVVEAT